MSASFRRSPTYDSTAAANDWRPSMAFEPRKNSAAGGRPGGPQLQIGNASRNVDAGLAGHRNRLQRDRTIRAADQHIGAETHGEGRLAGRADVAARQRTTPRALRWGKHTPHHALPGGHPDIEPEFVDHAYVALARPWPVRRKDAGHGLARSENPPKAPRHITVQHTRLDLRLRGGSEQQYGQSQPSPDCL